MSLTEGTLERVEMNRTFSNWPFGKLVETGETRGVPITVAHFLVLL